MKSIKAEVAIKMLFSRLKAAIVKPRIAPPVPRSPAEKPDKEPPITAFLLLAGTTSFLLIKKSKLNPTRKTPRMISRNVLSTHLVSSPPKITKITEGIPIDTRSRLFNPLRNKKILLKLLAK